MKGGKGKTMERSTIMWIVIGVLFIAVLYMTFKVALVGAGAGAAVKSAAITTTQTASAMVGGC